MTVLSQVRLAGESYPVQVLATYRCTDLFCGCGEFVIKYRDPATRSVEVAHASSIGVRR